MMEVLVVENAANTTRRCKPERGHDSGVIATFVTICNAIKVLIDRYGVSLDVIKRLEHDEKMADEVARAFNCPIDTSVIDRAMEQGNIRITRVTRDECGRYSCIAFCPECRSMVKGYVTPNGFTSLDDHGHNGDPCDGSGMTYDLSTYNPRLDILLNASPTIRVEKRQCPRCHQSVDAEIRDTEDPRDREVRILAHEECSYTGDGCEIFTTRCRNCGSGGIKARYDWKGNLWYDHHDVPDGMSCAAADPVFCDPYHLEGLVGEDSFGTHLIVQDTEP